MVASPAAIQMRPVAYMRSPYKQKFAVPRQPDLVREAVGEIHFVPEFADINAVRGLDQFSHLWLVFHFHETAAHGWTPTVTPPRLGGTARVGVFATRATFRPNAIGISVVEFVDIQQRGPALILRVRGVDLVDGTPILDIKPYVPYADAKPGARGGYAETVPGAELQISFSMLARQQLGEFAPEYPELENFIIAVLRQDPRPARHVRQEAQREFGMFLYDLNIRWLVTGNTCEVLRIEKANNSGEGS